MRNYIMCTMRRCSRNKPVLWIMAGIILLLFFWYENNHLVTDKYTYESDKIPKDLDGYKILQLSDLHDAVFGRDNKRLLAAITRENPDIIVITGDLVHSDKSNIDRTLDFTKQITSLYPVYFVTGNHEYWLETDNSEKYYDGLRENGVRILNNEKIVLKKGDFAFNLLGLDDNNLTDGTLNRLMDGNEKELNILLAHEPQYISNYAKEGVDLVFAGHAHGGQIRLPFIGGVVAPGQGFNPEYTEGKYTYNNTQMIVSRGLGNSIFPIRLFNHPEIVCVELKSKNIIGRRTKKCMIADYLINGT